MSRFVVRRSVGIAAVLAIVFCFILIRLNIFPIAGELNARFEVWVEPISTWSIQTCGFGAFGLSAFIGIIDFSPGIIWGMIIIAAWWICSEISEEDPYPSVKIPIILIGTFSIPLLGLLFVPFQRLLGIELELLWQFLVILAAPTIFFVWTMVEFVRVCNLIKTEKSKRKNDNQEKPKNQPEDGEIIERVDFDNKQSILDKK